MKWRQIIVGGLVCAAVAGVILWVLHARQAAIHRMLSENHRHVDSIDTGELAHPEMRGPDGR